MKTQNSRPPNLPKQQKENKVLNHNNNISIVNNINLKDQYKYYYNNDD